MKIKKYNGYYFSKKENAFYHSEIHTVDEMPDNVVKITDEQYEELLNALNSGCIIFDDLTYSEPKPTQFHNWNGTEWVLDEQAQNESIIQQQQAKKAQLMNEVKEEIEILQDTIDFDEHDEQDEAYLLELKKYRVQLNKVDLSVIDCEFPEKPQK